MHYLKKLHYDLLVPAFVFDAVVCEEDNAGVSTFWRRDPTVFTTSLVSTDELSNSCNGVALTAWDAHLETQVIRVDARRYSFPPDLFDSPSQ